MLFNYSDAEKELDLHLSWVKNDMPIQLTDPIVRTIELGLSYMFGRDRSLIPIMHFCPKVFIDNKIDLGVSILATQFISQYVVDNHMYAGKSENWLTVFDLNNVGITALPRDWIVEFINKFKHHYYQRNVGMFLLNSPFMIKFLWSFLSVFIPESTKKKITIVSSNTRKLNMSDLIDQKLLDRVHPSQLQIKFGGEAENITEFWPPRCPSYEFGIDPSKILSEEETIVMQNSAPVESTNNFTFSNNRSKVVSVVTEDKQSTSSIYKSCVEERREPRVTKKASLDYSMVAKPKHSDTHVSSMAILVLIPV